MNDDWNGSINMAEYIPGTSDTDFQSADILIFSRSNNH